MKQIIESENVEFLATIIRSYRNVLLQKVRCEETIKIPDGVLLRDAVDICDKYIGILRSLPELPAVETAEAWFKKRIAELESDPEEMADLRRMLNEYDAPVEAERCEWEYVFDPRDPHVKCPKCGGKEYGSVVSFKFCPRCGVPTTINTGGRDE